MRTKRKEQEPQRHTPDYAKCKSSGRVIRLQLPHRAQMTFGESIKTCFSKYADFSGRADRSEYWWFELFLVLLIVGAGIVNEMLANLVSLAVLLPSLAVGARRLHDVNKSGWWQLLYLVPLVGWIVVIYWSATPGREPNQY